MIRVRFALMKNILVISSVKELGKQKDVEQIPPFLSLCEDRQLGAGWPDGQVPVPRRTDAGQRG